MAPPDSTTEHKGRLSQWLQHADRGEVKLSELQAVRALEPYLETIRRVFLDAHEEYLLYARPQFSRAFKEAFIRGSVLSAFLRHHFLEKFHPFALQGSVKIHDINKARICTIGHKYNLRIKRVDEVEDPEDFKVKSQSYQFQDYCEQKSLPGIDFDFQENLIIGYESDFAKSKIGNPTIYKPNGLDSVEWRYRIEKTQSNQAIDTQPRTQPKQHVFKPRSVENEKSASES